MYHWIYIYNIHTCIHIYLNKENKQSKTEHKYNNIILWFRSHRCSHNLVNWSQRHSPNLLNSIHIAPSKMCTQHVAPSMESKIAKKKRHDCQRSPPFAITHSVKIEGKKKKKNYTHTFRKAFHEVLHLSGAMHLPRHPFQSIQEY